MKFAALALTLLLAVGSQAASLQSDAPSNIDHIRAATGLYVTQVKEGIKKALDGIDDPNFTETKNSIIKGLDDLHAQMTLIQQSVSPVTDSVISTIAEATSDFRASVVSDLEILRADLAPKRDELKKVMEKHFDEYKALLQPIIADYTARHDAEMADLKTKLEPILGDLQVKITANVEETKNAMVPIVETIRAKLQERLEAFKIVVTPYVQEYREQLQTAVQKAQSVNTGELREKIAPLGEELKTKFQEIFEVLATAFNKD